MKKLTLDETWRLCLEMWEWVVEHYDRSRVCHVEELKENWLLEHGFSGIAHDCFFCEYQKRHGDPGSCNGCPGRDVQVRWHCSNYPASWCEKPATFIAKLKRMNKLRKRSK